MCLVDDGQWLDRASAQALAFVARRLLAEPIALLFAVREPNELHELDGLPHHTIAGLSERDARVLLESSVPGRLDDRVPDRIVAESRGNPLALLELPRALARPSWPAAIGAPTPSRWPTQIEQSFLRRIRTLPLDTRRLLLTAAAEPVGDVPLLWRATASLGIDRHGGARRGGRVDRLGTSVRFRHPSPIGRLPGRFARRPPAGAPALAEATDPEADPDRRAWHRAHAAAAPDDAVAADLERSADAARARGGVAAAGALLARAAELTADPVVRGRRAIAAAQAEFEAGAPDVTDDLLALAERSPRRPDPRPRCPAPAQSCSPHPRPRRRAAAARGGSQLEAFDPAAARETYLEALGAAIFAGRSGTAPGLREVAELASASPPIFDAPRPIDLLLEGTALRLTLGHPAAVVALPAPSRPSASRVGTAARQHDWFWLAWMIAGELWDDELWEELATRAVQLARDAGALGELPIALIYRAAVHVHAGEFGAAAALIEGVRRHHRHHRPSAIDVHDVAARRVAERRHLAAGHLRAAVVNGLEPARDGRSGDRARDGDLVQRTRPLRRGPDERSPSL